MADLDTFDTFSEETRNIYESTCIRMTHMTRITRICKTIGEIVSDVSNVSGDSLIPRREGFDTILKFSDSKERR